MVSPNDCSGITTEEMRDIRHGIRNVQQSLAGLQAFREADSLRLEDKFKRIDARLEHIEDRVNGMSDQMSKWKGFGAPVVFVAGAAITGLVAWFFGQK